MLAVHHQDLLVVEHRLEAQAGLVERIRRDQQIDFVAEQRADSAKLEFLFDVDIHIRPAREVRRHDLEQPLVTRMAFHADPQCATFALCILAKALLSEVELRQQAVGHGEQILTALGQAQAPPLAQPDIRTQLLLQFFHGVAERGLRHAQNFRRGG